MITPDSVTLISQNHYSPETILLISVGYFIAKHFVGDFVLQNSYQLANKARYGHPGGLLHAAIHGALSLPLIVLLPGIQFGWFATIILAEAIAHYHIDWGKDKLLKTTKWTTKDQKFWTLLGFDQFLHLACYIVMTALIVGQYKGVHPNLFT